MEELGHRHQIYHALPRDQHYYWNSIQVANFVQVGLVGHMRFGLFPQVRFMRLNVRRLLVLLYFLCFVFYLLLCYARQVNYQNSHFHHYLVFDVIR